jgi:hypothetical protein
MLSGQVDLAYVFRFVIRRTLQRGGDAARSLLRAVGLHRPERLEQDLTRISERGRRLHFVFAKSDPGHELLMRSAGPTVRKLSMEGALHVSVLPEGDHTFSRKADRTPAIDAIVRASTVEWK